MEPGPVLRDRGLNTDALAIDLRITAAKPRKCHDASYRYTDMEKMAVRSGQILWGMGSATVDYRLILDLKIKYK